MPLDEHGQKWSCIPCIHGHRTAQCQHYDRWMVKVRKPGRPARGCQHAERQRCECERTRWMMVEVRHDANVKPFCKPMYSETDVPPDGQTHQQREADVQREMAVKQQQETQQQQQQMARLPPTPPDSQLSPTPNLQQPQQQVQHTRRESKNYYRQQHQHHHHQHHQQVQQQLQRQQQPPFQMLSQSPVHLPVGAPQQPLYFHQPLMMGVPQQQQHQLLPLAQPNPSVMSHIDPCIGQHEHFGEYDASLSLVTEPSTHQTNCCSSSGSNDVGDAIDSKSISMPHQNGVTKPRCSCPSSGQCHCKNCDDHPFNPPNNRGLQQAFRHLHPYSQDGAASTIDAMAACGLPHQHFYPSYTYPQQMTVDPSAVMPPPSAGITTRQFLVGFSEPGDVVNIEARDGLNLDPAWWSSDLS